MAKRQWWWIDPSACAVVRGRRVVVLGFAQFAMFRELHRANSKYEAKKVLSDKLHDAIYNGAINPAGKTLHMLAFNMNKKLARIDLKICGHNHKQNSFYQIRDLRGVL